jgi:hypothetical protein
MSCIQGNPCRIASTVLLALAGLALSGRALAALQDPEATAKPVVVAQSTEPQWEGDPYLLPTDPVTAKRLGAVDTQVVLVHEDRQFRFASQESADLFAANPHNYIPGVDAKLVKQQLRFYPLANCLVSDEKLSEESFNLVYLNRLVRLSKRSYESIFLQDPASFLDKLDAAVIARQKPLYAAKNCPVSGEPLGAMGEPIDYVVGNRLVRLCCTSCIEDVTREPLKYLELFSAHPQGD